MRGAHAPRRRHRIAHAIGRALLVCLLLSLGFLVFGTLMFGAMWLVLKRMSP